LPDAPGLEELGFSPRWQALFAPHADAGLVPARVVRSDRGSWLVAGAAGVARARLSTRLRKAGGAAAVGDWVALLAPAGLDTPLIEAVLERAGAITRGAPGRTSAVQVLAANVDTVFVAHPLDGPPNLRRIERELSLAWESGAVPVVVLTKADLCDDPEAARGAVAAVAPGAEVLVTSATARDGIDALRERVSGRRTAVLIGPSGAGKSTLVNALLGEERQATRAVRVRDGRGRHVTVARELIAMPGGGVLIDTPGLRELGLTGTEAGIGAAFPEIEQAARGCRFRDCMHEDEPDCAVRAAVETGALPAERLASWHKLVHESRGAARRSDVRLRAEEQRRWKIIRKSAREFYKRTGRGR
jgi:ribosome biogenesis GTPase / thiamine phosphate phosphatase